METKQCSKCKKVFPRNKEHFHLRKTSNDGLRGQCKNCENKIKNQSRKKYFLANPKAYEKHKQNSNERTKKRYNHLLKNNPEYKKKRAAYMQNYRNNNFEYVQNYWKDYYERNKEKIDAYGRKRDQIRRTNMTDSYIKKLIYESIKRTDGITDFQSDDTPKELISLARMNLKLKRNVKEKTSSKSK